MSNRTALAVVFLVALSTTASFAGDNIGGNSLPIVLTADDNPTPGANSATAYHVNTTTGQMTFLKTLKTGGTGLGLSSDYANSLTAITGRGNCVYVANTGSDTISWFEGPNYNLGGSAGIPGMFSANGLGGSIAIDPNNTWVASANTGLGNISMWQINGDCSLSLIGSWVPEIASLGTTYFPTLGFPAKSKNGIESLVVTAPNVGGIEFFHVTALGDLQDRTYAVYSNLSGCEQGCSPIGMDFTTDGAVAVFGNGSLTAPAVLTATLGAANLNPQVWSIANAAGLVNPQSVWFSQLGAGNRQHFGNGELYVGMSGDTTAGFPAGEVTTLFEETSNAVNVEGSGTAIPTPDGILGGLRTYGATGNEDGAGGGEMVIAVYPNILQPAAIGPNGTLILEEPTTDPNAASLFSISLYPPTR